MLVTRLARSEDFARIAQLHVLSWQSAYSEDFPAEHLAGGIAQRLDRFWRDYIPKPTDIVVVAEAETTQSKLSGFCAIWCDASPYLDNLHVAPTAKGQGVGRVILGYAAAELKRRGHTTLTLSVFESNHAARKFYRRCGGEEVGRYDQDIFGQKVPSVDVTWSDLSPLLRAASS